MKLDGTVVCERVFQKCLCAIPHVDTVVKCPILRACGVCSQKGFHVDPGYSLHA